MSKNKKTLIILFVHRNQFTMWVKGKSELVAMPFGEDIVKDLEFVQKDKLEEQLKAFFASQKINPENHEMLMVLSDAVTFSRDLEHAADGEAKSEEIKKFVQLVPFEAKYTRDFKIGKRTMIISVNRKFYHPLAKRLQGIKFDVIAMVPQVAVDETLVNPDLTPELAEHIVGNIDDLKKNYNFLVSEDKKDQGPVTDINKPSKKREMLLAGVFVVLLVVLGGVFYWTQKQNETLNLGPVKPTIKPVTASPTTTLTPIPAVIESSTPSAQSTTSGQLNRSSITIQILNGSGVAGQADVLKSRFEQLGYTLVTTANAGNVTGVRTSIVVHQDVSTEIREELMQATKEVTGTDANIQENNGLPSRVTITTYR